MVESRAAIPMGIIANEFITNFLKHAVRENRYDTFLSVVNGEKGIEIELSDSDSGDGLGDALDHLNDTGSGSGLSYIEVLVQQIGAERTWSSDGGTSLKISLRHPRGTSPTPLPAT